MKRLELYYFYRIARNCETIMFTRKIHVSMLRIRLVKYKIQNVSIIPCTIYLSNVQIEARCKNYLNNIKIQLLIEFTFTE